MTTQHLVSLAIKGFDSWPRLGEAAKLQKLAEAVAKPEYRDHSIGDRKLQVPVAELMVAHRLLHQLIRLALPQPKGVHSLVQEVNSLLQAQPTAKLIRTDFRKCFPSLLPATTIPKVLGVCQRALQLVSDEPQFWASFLPPALQSLFPNTRGVSTGSPASPSFLEAVLHDVQPTLPGVAYWRYVDDILLIGDVSPSTLTQIQPLFDSFGLNFNEAKTVIGEAATGFTFLGRSFNTPAPDKTRFGVQFSSQFPAAHYPETFEVHCLQNDLTYERTATHTVWRIDTLHQHVEKGAIDAWMAAAAFRSSAQVQGLNALTTALDSMLSKDALFSLHANAWKVYVKSVKGPREKGIPINPREAERVLYAMALSVFVQRHGVWPNATELSQDFPAFVAACAEAPSGAGQYHTLIKALFKEDWHTRERGQPRVPAEAPLIARWMQSEGAYLLPEVHQELQTSVS